MHGYAYESDTIAAVATAPGKGGIAIVKVSGPDAVSLVQQVFSGTYDPERLVRRMVHGYINDNGEHIDEVLVCVMKSPHSYTGEDVVEVQSHGGTAAATSILSLLIQRGARHAAPGEFTRRAFMNGKIDLAQAEGVMEVVSAANRAHLKRAERLLDGLFSRHIDNLLEQLGTSLALIEYRIEFAEESDEDGNLEEIRVILAGVTSTLETMIASFPTARRIKDGLNVVIAGAVNVGKSSLFNTLLGRKRAIVNKREGTTRDWIEEKIELDGIAVNLIDTAGLRDTDDDIEREGVHQTRHLLQKADIIISLHDPEEQSRLLDSAADQSPTIPVLSKSDLPGRTDGAPDILAVSSVTREGIDTLISKLSSLARDMITIGDADALVLVDRHQKELREAYKHLAHACLLLETNIAGRGPLSEELVADEIHRALNHLELVIGEHVSLDILDEIFSRFCVGK